MPTSQRSTLLALRRTYSATSGFGSSRKRSSAIASITTSATSEGCSTPSSYFGIPGMSMGG
jgi:hypothetical protein